MYVLINLNYLAGTSRPFFIIKQSEQDNSIPNNSKKLIPVCNQ